MTSLKICHLTSAHARDDVRIFFKMCVSLANKSFDVSLVVADGKPDELKAGVKIYNIGEKPKGRLTRMSKVVIKIFTKAKLIDADIYHLHDPELMPVGLMLKRLGKVVIFDAHEDFPAQLLSKPYLNFILRYILSKFFAYYERYACKKFDGLIGATPFIRNKFSQINQNTIDINNFPILGELDSNIQWSEKKLEICYVGNISKIRGIFELLKALSFIRHPAKLNLAGRFYESDVESCVKSSPEWSKINYFGFQDREGIKRILANSKIGLVILHPQSNYLDAQPIKMYEYMSAGIPLIASNFPLWREIVDDAKCGVCVDPFNPQEIASAIDHLLNNQSLSRQMGENGRRAVYEKYNWQNEAEKLINFYKLTCSRSLKNH